MAWLATKPESVWQRLGLKNGVQLEDYTFKGLVISSRTLGLGFVESDPEIPLTNEPLIREFLRLTDNAFSLETLWAWCSQRPILGTHFSLQDVYLAFAGKTFSLKNFAATGTNWDQYRYRPIKNSN